MAMPAAPIHGRTIRIRAMMASIASISTRAAQSSSFRSSSLRSSMPGATRERPSSGSITSRSPPTAAASPFSISRVLAKPAGGHAYSPRFRRLRSVLPVGHRDRCRITTGWMRTTDPDLGKGRRSAATSGSSTACTETRKIGRGRGARRGRARELLAGSPVGAQRHVSGSPRHADVDVVPLVGLASESISHGSIRPKRAGGERFAATCTRAGVATASKCAWIPCIRGERQMYVMDVGELVS